MSKSRHIILRQILEWNTGPGEQTANEMAARLSRLCNGRLATILESALDRFDQPGLLIRIDQLQLDLDYDGEMDLEKWIESALPAALDKALREATEQQETIALSVEAADLELLIAFLKTGKLPWSAPDKLSLQELEYRITEALANHPEWIDKIADLLHNSLYLTRLLQQFSIQMPWRIARLLYPDLAENLPEKWAEIADQPHHPARAAFWKMLLESGTIPENARAEDFEKKGLSEADTEKNKPEATASDQAFFIQNAGLVLLHPYLRQLFDYTNVLENETVGDADKALFLLHYALTGETEAPEWEMVLPKILCGIPLDNTAWRQYKLSKADRQQTDDLLETLISHWTALGDTSIDGLRGSFLQRNGRLIEHEDYWSLKVEQMGYDMLLDQLPWGIGIIKLPWMEKPVYTEWG